MVRKGPPGIVYNESLDQTKQTVAPKSPLRLAVHLLLAAFAVYVCAKAVSWEIRPRLFPMMDEVGMLTRFLNASYAQVITLLPHAGYNDRPFGFALEQLLYSFFAFDYRPQLICYLAIHSVNCAFGYFLFRRLGVSVPLSIAGIGLFGGLWTTAATVTYLGEVDMLCLFFLLGSALTFVSEKRGATVLSAVLFLLALRTKEFAIMTPAVFAILGLFMAPQSSARQKVLWVARRLWMHLVIGITFGIVYLTFIPQMRKFAPPGSPYHMQMDARTILDSWSYYIALIFGQDGTILEHLPLVCGLAVGAILIYSLIRRDLPVLFSLSAFVLFLLPVSMLANQRAQFYAYAPQMFLILAGCLLLERAIALFSKREPVRWAAAVGVALALMSWVVELRRSPYFRNRMAWTLMVRSTSATTAADVQVLLPKLAPGSHIYINNGDQTPWLFVPGPCAYFQVARRENRRSVASWISRKPPFGTCMKAIAVRSIFWIIKKTGL